VCVHNTALCLGKYCARIHLAFFSFIVPFFFPENDFEEFKVYRSVDSEDEEPSPEVHTRTHTHTLSLSLSLSYSTTSVQLL
jgi:hypothetical protein